MSQVWHDGVQMESPSQAHNQGWRSECAEGFCIWGLYL